jgi:hypothetical protein
MSEKAQAKARSSVKSGNEGKQYAKSILGGYPAEKSVKAINDVNKPGKAPGSVSA